MGVFGDIGRGFNDGLDALEDGVDAGKRVLGEGIDYATDKVGDELDRVGLHGAADTVEDWGDGVASDLGATPGEQQLGQTEEADELVHGNPGAIRASAGHLKDFSAAFDKVGSGLRKVDSSGWQGRGGESFRKKFDVHPTKWLHSADACETAADALKAYADTVQWAQREARDAIELHKQGKRASEDAARAYNARVDAYNANVKAGQDPGPRPEPFRDPGDADIRAAWEKLTEARRQRDSAAIHAQDKVEEAMSHAPAKPPLLDRLGIYIADGYQAVNVEFIHVVGGVIKGAAGLLTFVRGLNPMDPYNLAHPAEYMQNVSLTLSGLVSTATHPERAAKAAADGFKKDPSEFSGRLYLELLGTKGAGLGRSGLRLAAKEGLETGASNAIRNGATHAEELSGARHAPPAGVADDAAPHANPSATNGLPPGWTIDDAATHSPPTGMVDDAAGKNWDDLAQVTDDVREPAVHGDSVDSGTAQDFVDDRYPSLGDINDAPGTHAGNDFEHPPHTSAEDFKSLSTDQKHEVAAAELNDGAVSFPDDGAAIAYGRENWNDYAQNLPESTRKSLFDYSDDHLGAADPRYATYKEMNGYLRGNADLGTPDVLRNIEEVDKALAGRRLPEDVMVVRGQGVSHLGVEPPGELVGRTITEPAYMSTSLGNNPVAAFEGNTGILHLRVPEGTDALWMEKVSHYGMGERELLLGRDTSYQVTRAFKDENGKWHIYGEVLPKN